MADAVADTLADTLQVYVSYATAQREFLRPLRVPPGTTIGQAVETSGVLAEFPEINLVTQPVGIYRPLIADPKDSRRKRAAKKDAPPRSEA